MGDACQVDFYVLASSNLSAERLACRLAMMAWEQGHKVVVLTASDKDAATLDEIMWDFPAGRFLPHSRAEEDVETPVRIEIQGADISAERDLVINLTDQPVSDPERFGRLLEIVPGEEHRRIASRQKFRAYRDIGLEPVSHQIAK